jgi:DNA-directed RNA polymerase sigma subunit (sigma70/sigma32)
LGKKEHTLEEIGQGLRVGRERARQIEMKALKRLRHAIWSKIRLGIMKTKEGKKR